MAIMPLRHKWLHGVKDNVKKLEVTGNHVSKRYTFSSIPNTGEGVNRKIDEPIYF